MEGTGVPIRLDIWEFLRTKHIKYSSKDAFQEKNLAFDSFQRLLREELTELPYLLFIIIQ